MMFSRKFCLTTDVIRSLNTYELLRMVYTAAQHFDRYEEIRLFWRFA